MSTERFRRLLFFLVLSLSTCVAQYFPETGRAALYQRSLDSRSRLHVLSISLQPGYEDLAALAYFRMARGARVVSAYVTNGEAGESDVRGEYPHQLAALRREEAAQAMALIGGEEYFLTMPDIAAAADTGFVREVWGRDTLQTRLMRLISVFRPDLILLSRDWARGGNSPQLDVLQDDLLQAVRRIARPIATTRSGSDRPLSPWSVARILVDRNGNAGAQAEIGRTHPHWRKTYREIGEEAAQAYVSLAVQREQWYRSAGWTDTSRRAVSYDQVYPRSGKLKNIDQGLPTRVSQHLAGIERQIASLMSATLRGRSTISLPGGGTESVLTRLSAIIDSLDLLLSQPGQLTTQDRKITLQWKLAHERLRTALLGVTVEYTFNPTLLTERQLTLLKIDTITGTKPGGNTSLYFPAIDQGWIINESLQRKLPLKLHEDYRLISPAHLEYDLPASSNGIQRTTVGRLFILFVVHEAKKRDENFMYQIGVPLQYSPRFTAEILTPIVRVTPSERLALRLTNHSRDGVRDWVYVDDSLAVAPKRQFRLNVKDESHLDTLILTWRRPLEEGTYVVPVKISTQEVGVFAGRQFDALVDSTKRVGFISGIDASPTADALRRLRAVWNPLKVASQLPNDLAAHEVVILDRRALTFIPDLRMHTSDFQAFVERGGHLIVLAQDADVWNSWGLIDGLQLTPSHAFDELAGVDTDSTHRLLNSPNRIRPEDWTDWLQRRAFNELSGPALERADIPVKVHATGAPLVVTWKRGGGTLTYADLALHAQFLNVHPGSYRLLANLISY